MKLFKYYFCFFMLFLGYSFAKSIDLETGHYIFDKTRNLEIDQFDYIYSIDKIIMKDSDASLVLNDGSIWNFSKPNAESNSFFKLKSGEELDFSQVLQAVISWSPGEHLIFHKVINRKTILVYNIERDQLFDVYPEVPSSESSLQIIGLKIYKSVHTKKDEKNQSSTYVHYDAIIKLNDGTIWASHENLTEWNLGDSIFVAKDTPYAGCNTHIFLNWNMESKNKKPNRIGVVRCN